jgi:transcriptional regulator with XRE-family HTH domain
MMNTTAALTHTVKIPSGAPTRPVLLRQVVGETLRARRKEQGRTLREVSRRAQVSLGYLSEVERGQKEASSELLASICGALDVSLSDVLIDVAAELAGRQRPVGALPPRACA